jgi:hypothetical protein
MYRQIHNPLSALILSLYVSFLSGCATPTPPPPTLDRVVVTHPAKPSTSCPPQPLLPAAALASPEGFAAWLNSDVGRGWLATGRQSGWECYTKLQAVGAQP